ncbi:MAG: hypothetical protein ACTHJM_00740 [Marmoricola sp.]
MHPWNPRAPWPSDLTIPVPLGSSGLTVGKARGPHWRQSSRGMYVPATADVARVEQRILETVPRIPKGGAISGWAALRVWGGGFFDGFAPDGRTALPIPIAVPRSARLARTLDIWQVRSELSRSEMTHRHGIPVTRPERAVLDEVRRVADLRSAVVIIDMALVARLTSLELLQRMAGDYRGRPGTGQLRRALVHATNRSRSPRETRMRLIWTLDAGLPTPLCNWPLADQSRRYLGKPDLLSPELGIYGEFDGADHRTRDRHRIDVRREQAFRDVGLEGFTLVGADLDDPALAVTRMRAAVRRAQESRRPRAWLLATHPPPLI